MLVCILCNRMVGLPMLEQRLKGKDVLCVKCCENKTESELEEIIKNHKKILIKS